MDKYSEMSPALRKAAVAVLERAAEEFSNHGCTDFDLCKDAGLTKDEALDVMNQLHEWNNAPNEPKPKRGDTATDDWCILWLLAAILENE